MEPAARQSPGLLQIGPASSTGMVTQLNRHRHFPSFGRYAGATAIGFV